MKINPLIQPIKVQNAPLKLSGKTVHLGDFLKGSVVQADGQNLTLSVDGELLAVLNASDQTVTVGEGVTIEVTGFEGEVALAEVLPEQSEELVVDKPVNKVLMDLKMPVTEENQRMVQSMMDLKVPLTEENVKEIKAAYGSLKMLVSNEGENKDQMPMKVDIPIKDAVIAFLKSESREVVAKEGLEGQVKSQKNAVLPSQTPLLEGQTSLETAPKEAVSLGENTDQTIEGEKLINTVPKDQILTVLKDVVDNGEVEKFTMLVKAKLPLDLKNAMLSEQIVSGKKTITESVSKINQVILALKDAGVLEGLPKGLLKRLDQPMELLKLVESELDGKELPKEVADLKETLVNESQFLRDSVQFVEDLNQEIGFMQVPLMMNEEIVNMDLYSSEGSGKKGQESFSIFVYLDTKTLSKVQVSIKKYPDQVLLNFLLEDEKIKKVFEMQSDSLKKGLEALEFGKFSLYFNERETSHTLTDFLKDVNKQGSFDIKV